MPGIICYHCFGRFAPRELEFKCAAHTPPWIFPWSPRPWEVRPPDRVLCHQVNCRLLTSHRVCPHCRHDLPYYVGRSSQQIVSITGCQNSGKTLYLWALLYQLRERLVRDPSPYAAAMFEDDESFHFYQRLCETILHGRELPEATQAVEQRQGELKPVIVRLLRKRRRGMCNLIFFDHAGELIHALRDVRYLQYLAHSAALIYLVDPTDGQGSGPDPKAASLAAQSLSNICQELRERLQVKKADRLPQRLAVVLTKADQSVFPRTPAADLIANFGGDQTFWKRRGRARRAAIGRSSLVCQRIAEDDLGLANLIRIVEGNFKPGRVRFFAISSLGKPFGEVDASHLPEPIGVEHPLFTLLNL